MNKNLRDNIIELQKQFIMPCVEVWHDILFVKGQGAKLYDSEGKDYIDCFAGVAVANIGHCHPKVIEVVKKQLEKLTHLSTLYYTEPMPRLAKRLSEIVPIETKKIKKSFFCNSGTEANEHAITLAKKATGKNEVISHQCGFYGRGGTTMGLTGLGGWRSGLGPFVPGIFHAPSYYCYRCPMGYKNGPPECNYACARYIEYMLRTETSQRVAAFMAEPILGVGGCVPAPREYFKVVKEILDENDILLIVDEVQTGNGRTGKLFAIEHYGVEPDIITMAKGLGGGFPIGAVVSKADIADKHLGPDFSTFGGNPVSCMAALATIEVLFDENLPENAEMVGGYMLKRLKEMESRHKIIDCVQGQGLMIGLEVVTDKDKRTPAEDDLLIKIMKKMAARGVLVGRGGLFYNRIRFEPPLCITKEQARWALDTFEEVLDKVEREL